MAGSVSEVHDEGSQQHYMQLLELSWRRLSFAIFGFAMLFSIVGIRVIEVSLIEQLQKLEEEKNALLDYIEESEASKHESKILNEMSTEGSKMSPNEMNMKMVEMSQMIRQLEAEKAHLYQMTEDLKYQEGMSR